MYLEHWGLTGHPFRPRAGDLQTPLVASQQEALARLHFLVESGWRAGTLRGTTGSGKSLVLARLAAELRRRGEEAWCWSLTGTGPGELAQRLVEAWQPCQLGTGLTAAEAWRIIEDQLRAAHFQRRSLVILLDDADDLSGPLADELRRLAATAERTQTRLSLVLAAENPAAAAPLTRLAPAGSLRVELAEWDEAETVEQITTLLARAGRTAPLFEPSALARLHALGGGNPRHTLALAELALAAGAAQELTSIDAATVDLVYESLDATAPAESLR